MSARLGRGGFSVFRAAKSDGGVGQGPAVDLAIERLPLEVLVVDISPDLSRRRPPCVGQDAAHGNFPSIAIPRPDTFAKASLGVEDPTANLLAGRIPADALRD